ncbi:hypothetical protein HDU96_005681 [Phlyctochytrium bullatum]|nr:hypothetical protein HDU96_005681 [Phlyctochytrium bullatum]
MDLVRMPRPTLHAPSCPPHPTTCSPLSSNGTHVGYGATWLPWAVLSSPSSSKWGLPVTGFPRTSALSIVVPKDMDIALTTSKVDIFPVCGASSGVETVDTAGSCRRVKGQTANFVCYQ